MASRGRRATSGGRDSHNPTPSPTFQDPSLGTFNPELQLQSVSDSFNGQSSPFLVPQVPPTNAFQPIPSGPDVGDIMGWLTSMFSGETPEFPEEESTETRVDSTWDNYFSGDTIFDWLGEQGFGATMTCRRDRLPKDIPGNHLHKKKTNTDPRSKAARFLHPIVAVKDTPASEGKKAHQRVLCTFQSTSSCNIHCVNALDECSGYPRKKERGRGANKRVWAIEMNHARELYLSSYFKIDTMDHLIKNSSMFYRSWKYWHSAMLHGKALAVVVAYDMYIECAEGRLDSEWKLSSKDTMDFFTFRDHLSLQMLSYNPTARKYKGDDGMHKCTVQNTQQRARSQSQQDVVETTPMGFTMDPSKLEEAQRPLAGRLCGDLSKFLKHCESITTSKNGRKCEMCGELAYTVCGECGKAVHYFPQRGAGTDKNCMIDFHNDLCFGLARSDCGKVLTNKRKKDWSAPSDYQKKRHATFIRSLQSRTTQD